MKTIKAIIFDFDGVIHNTFEFHRKKIKEFTGAGLSKQEFREIHNGNFFDNENNKIKNIDWMEYKDYIYQELSSLEIEKEIESVLLKLHVRYNLFIISSGGAKNISSYLKKNNIDFVFKEVIGVEFHKSKVKKFDFIFDKYKLKPENCFFVTDTLGDILEANDLSIKTIAVDFGYHKKEILEKGNPFRIISKMNEIFAELN